MINLEYDKQEKEIIDFFEKNKVMVLSTGCNNKITSRMMSVVNDGLLVYFQTGKRSVKYKQIVKNKNVALCIANMQLEGKAKIMDHPYNNEFFKNRFSIIHPGSFKTYSHLKDAIVFEIKPDFITFWKYDADGKPYQDFIDLNKKSAYREYYNITD